MAFNAADTPFAEETLDPDNQSRGDTKEGFYFGRCLGDSNAQHRLKINQTIKPPKLEDMQSDLMQQAADLS